VATADFDGLEDGSVFRKFIVCCFVLGIFASAVPLAHSEPRLPSATCQRLTTASTKELDRKIGSLQLTIRNLKATQARVSSQGTKKFASVDGRLRAAQQDLIELIFDRDCLRNDLQDDPVLISDTESADGKRAPTPWITVTVYYGTNRAVLPGDNKITQYGPDRTPDISFGTAEVSAPTARQPGQLPLPSMWHLEFNTDPRKHFLLKNVQPLSRDAARQQLSSALSASTNKSVLLFVHGFNVTFNDAALRTAQMAQDLSFPGVPMFFSWPSAGNTRSYFRDEEVAQLSEKAFGEMLDEIAQLGASDVYVVAHSMGTRIVTNTLANVQRSTPSISELILAAPDINEQIFREQIVPGLATLTKTHRTIYASSNDVALKASKVAHEFRRVGDTVGGVLTFSGYETIDASLAAPIVRAFGHSYVMDSAKVLGDITDLLVRHKAIGERDLDKRDRPPDEAFWSLR
jgi:esterase/lipase superfamily enzyme